MVASRESTTCIVRVVSSTRLRNATLRPSLRRAVRSSWAICASAAERSRCTCPPVDVPVLVIGTLGRRRYGIGRIGVHLTRRGRGGRPGGRRLAAPGVGPGDLAGPSGGSPLARRPPEGGMPKPRALPQLATRVGVAAAAASPSSALWAVHSTEPEPAVGADAPDCYAEDAVLTVEEQRIGQPLVEGGESAAAQFLRAAGFEETVAQFATDLCAAPDLAAAEELVVRHGEALWELALARAQGERDIGTIDRYDDRPLYWARLDRKSVV